MSRENIKYVVMKKNILKTKLFFFKRFFQKNFQKQKVLLLLWCQILYFITN